MIPGSNLLNRALKIIAKQTVTYYKSLGRTLNDVGQDVTAYNEPVSIAGSLQPVSRVLYEKLGLDLQKTYYTFYTSNNVIDVGRNVSGDQFVFNGQRYQVESNNDWYAQDGWKGVLCVLIGAAS
jgi:hypothetical protein